MTGSHQLTDALWLSVTAVHSIALLVKQILNGLFAVSYDVNRGFLTIWLLLFEQGFCLAQVHPQFAMQKETFRLLNLAQSLVLSQFNRESFRPVSQTVGCSQKDYRGGPTRLSGAQDMAWRGEFSDWR